MYRATVSSAARWLKSWGFDVPEQVVWRPQAQPHDATTLQIPFDPPWFVKPDLALGHKGALGLVQRVDDRGELGRIVSAICGVLEEQYGRDQAVIIEQFIPGDEMYASVVLDDSFADTALRFSVSGGVDFRAEGCPSLRVPVGQRPREFQVRELIRRGGLVGGPLNSVSNLLMAMWQVWAQAEMTLLEVNPLIVGLDGPVCVGLNLEFDSVCRQLAERFRPPSLVTTSQSGMRNSEGRAVAGVEDKLGREPSRGDVRFVQLDGDVAVLVGGGGPGALCLDYLYRRGVRPACFMDTSPGMSNDLRKELIRVGLSLPGIRGALFGAVVLSVVDVTTLAEALVAAISEAGDLAGIPIVARIAGPSEEAAHDVIRDSGLPIHVIGRSGSLEDACDLLIRLMGDMPSDS